MKNYIQQSYSFDINAPQELKAGTPFIIGNFVGVPVDDAAVGQLVTVYMEGIFEFQVNEPVNLGDAVYLNKNGQLSKTLSDGVLCGYSVTSTSGGDVKIVLSKAINSASPASK